MQAADAELQGGGVIEQVRELRRAPHKDDDAEREPGQPCFEDRAGGVMMLARLRGDVFLDRIDDLLRLPYFQEADEGR